jgi:hypothetical protein
MTYDFAQLFRDNAVPHWTEGNNVSIGWTNTTCCFCDDPSNHLGFSEEGACACWRCGTHSTSEAIHLLTGLDWQNIQTSYLKGGATSFRGTDRTGAPPSLLNLPVGTKPMTDTQREYLITRNFDPDKLARDYGIKGTGIVGPYKFRIIVPILLGGKLVSYQGRDYTGLSDLRYKTCQKEHEVVCHKHTLYDIDRAGEDVVVVEGVTDVWRLGPGSVATFGTGFTQEQVMILAGYRRVFLLYDGEEAATRRADKLAHAISGLGAEVELVTLDGGDPAEMSQDDADYMMLELGLFK